jgi:hypothetical protein
MSRTAASDEGLVGKVHASAGGTVRVIRHDPPLPRGRYSVGHSVMDEAQVRHLISLLYAALVEPAPDAELARLRFIEENVRGQAHHWRVHPGPAVATSLFRECATDIEDILAAAGGPELPPPDHLALALEHLAAYRDEVRLTAGEPA